MYPQPIEKREVITGLKLPPEERFIIGCLRLRYGAKSNGEFPKFDPSIIDWNLVYEKSIKLRIIPLVYKIIQERLYCHQLLKIPDNFFQKMNTKYMELYNRNKTNFEGLVDILDVFNKTGIKVILLKGAHLAQFVYKDIALRSMGDIDILVRKEDLDKAKELLFQMGYTYQNKVDNIRRWYELHHHHLSPLSHPKGIKKLEVHWKISNLPMSLSLIEELWQRARPSAIGDVKTFLLCPEDLLLHLCLHNFFHHKLNSRTAIKTLCDISEIIRHYEYDWSLVYLYACQWGIKKCVYITLQLTKELLDTAIPEKGIDIFKPDNFDSQEMDLVKEIIFDEVGDISSMSTNLAQLCVNKRLKDKIAIFLKRTFPSPLDMARIYKQSYDSKKIYIYYPVRLIDLLWRYRQVGWGVLCHDKKIIELSERKVKKNLLWDQLSKRS